MSIWLATGCPDETSFLGVWEGVSRWDSHLDRGTQWSRLASPVWAGIIPSTEGLSRMKGGGRMTLSPSPHTHACLTELISCPRTGIYTIGSPGLKPSDLDWITPWLSWLPTWWIAWKFPASILHEKTPRNKSALYICCWLCYSGELISADGLPVGLGPKINICLIKTYFLKSSTFTT